VQFCPLFGLNPPNIFANLFGENISKILTLTPCGYHGKTAEIVLFELQVFAARLCSHHCIHVSKIQSEAGLPDFSWHNIPTKTGENIPNCQ
jgi:hypothetical protein